MTNVKQIIRKRHDRKRMQKQTRSARLLRAVITTVIALVIVVLAIIFLTSGLGIGVYFYFARDLPRPQEIVQARQQFESTLIYDRTGKTVLYQVIDPSAGDRLSVPLAEIPSSLINATLAIEDKTFYENPGFDVRGIARSMFIVISGGTVQGGSTITQQLVKNILLSPNGKVEETVGRKIKEVILASEISRLYDKDQILEWYLNNNFYGNLAYGVETASRVYFDKPVKDLTLAEAAMLAAIPQNPQLNPRDAPLESQQRQLAVLGAMVKYGFITQDDARQAASQPLIIKPESYGIIAPHFSIYARGQAEQLLDAQGLDGARLVSRGGMRIYTTLDLDLQYQAECVTRGYVQRLSGGSTTAAPGTSGGQPCVAANYLPNPPGFKLGVPRNVTNAATITIRPNTGEILSMVGSLDYWNAGIDGNYNAAQAQRQPGSTFKPFTYVTAFALGKYMPGSMVMDIPTTFNQDGVPYAPTNEDNQFHGPMSVRDALANSYNIPAVQTLADVGIGQVIRRAHALGINSLDGDLQRYGLALALGSGEVSLLDLTYSYTAFANMGFMAGTPTQNPRNGYRAFDPIAILRIDDKDGNTLWKLDEKQPDTFGKQNVLDGGLAYLINNILEDNEARLPAFGKGSALELSRPAAVKTGTTNDARDGWTVGYTPQLVTGVWVGNNNNSPMGDDITGGVAAGPIWHAIMEYAHARDNLPVQDWQRPATIVERTICKDSGLLPTADCPTVKDLFYVGGGIDTTPTQRDTYWKRYQVNGRNGLLATAFTPQNLITEKVFFNYPPGPALDWAKAHQDLLTQQGRPVPPSDYDSASAPTGTVEAGAISKPGALDRVRGAIDITGNLDPDKVVSYSLEYGAGLNPTEWTSIAGGDPNARGTDLLLGHWDTGGLDGLYTLRLGITLKDGNKFQPYILEVTVDNQGPTINVQSPKSGQTVSVSDQTVTLAADVNDNVGVDRAELYVDGQLYQTIRNAPYTVGWKINQPGEHNFKFVAYDTAGNSTTSDTILVNVK